MISSAVWTEMWTSEVLQNYHDRISCKCKKVRFSLTCRAYFSAGFNECIKFSWAKTSNMAGGWVSSPAPGVEVKCAPNSAILIYKWKPIRMRLSYLVDIKNTIGANYKNFIARLKPLNTVSQQQTYLTHNIDFQVLFQSWCMGVGKGGGGLTPPPPKVFG